VIVVELTSTAISYDSDPYCWTEYNLPEGVGKGRGTAWVWPSFLANGQLTGFTDEACQSESLFVPPIIAMQGHSAPLGIVFYEYTEERPEECGDIIPFPESYNRYAFIAFHGSWNRDIPTGFKVVYVPFDEEGNATGPPVDLLAHEPPNAKWEDGFRPVDVDFDDCGRLIVTSDGTGNQGSKIVNIQYTLSNETESTPAPTDATSPPSVPASTGSPSVEALGDTLAPTGRPGTACCPPSDTPAPSNDTSGRSSQVRWSLWISAMSAVILLLSPLAMSTDVIL
jgi:hypothetical protein